MNRIDNATATARTAQSEFIIANANLVLPDRVARGHLKVDGTAIAAIAEGNIPTGMPVLDLGGDYLLPGLIDIHTDHFERHVYPRPHVRWDYVRAALAHDAQIIGGGVTTVFDSLCVGATYDNPERREILAPMIDALESAQRDDMLKAEHFVHLRCEITDPETPALTRENIDREIVRVVSVMEHLPGIRQSRDIAEYIKRAKARSGESDEIIRDRMVRFVAEKSEIGRTVRPQIVALAKAHDLPLLSHDDVEEAHVTEARDEGGTISEFPCTLEAARAAHALGLKTVAGAPNYLRGGSQSGNVAVADLLAENLVDMLASDYVPRSLLDCAFALSRDEKLGFDLPRAVAMVSSAPAKAAKLDDRGAIAVGLRADLIQVGVGDGHPHVKRAWRAGERVY